MPYNPLDKRNLGASVADALLSTPLVPIDGLHRFQGAGIYAIYYRGTFKPYRPLLPTAQDGDVGAPIYVGKAIPAGARKGGVGMNDRPTQALFNRLAEHADSLRAVENLNVKDFFCRYLVVDDIWIPLGESLLIARFCPLWNNLIDGFGNHDPGSGRYKGLRPRWDVLHPGRGWALKCAERSETAAQIANDIAEFFRANLNNGESK